MSRAPSGHRAQPPTDAVVAEAILRLVGERAPGKSICPSEVARVLEADGKAWQQHMTLVRRVAGQLSKTGQVTILRHGKPIAPEAMRGVIRLTHGIPTPDTLTPDAGIADAINTEVLSDD